MEKTTTTRKSGSFISTLLITALIAGTLDMLGAIANYMINGGKNPTVIFQYIASAVFGKTAYDGSISMMAAGLLFHYIIAFIFTLFFFFLFPKLKLLSANSFLIAIPYGIFVWAVMNLIVLRLTRLAPVPFDLQKAAIAALILILCIGLPVVIGAKKYYRK
jgi:hypothetical protein